MTRNVFILSAAMLILSACGPTSHRPVYSGHQESTEGVPGFANGQKLSPYVKLGQSYSVDGETYVPRYQPDYVEEGDASWYGPGFHGGKTANGESFDKHELTAAHRTLPLPSIVRVTLLSTGKSAYVRINDRGPFSKGRIIDLSYGAADAIGLIGKGVDRVRVEYMPLESQRFAELLAQGREPKSIDMAEVMSQSTTQYARAEMPRVAPQSKTDTGWLGNLNPISSAQAAEPEFDPQATHGAADVDAISSQDLAAPAALHTPPSSTAKPVSSLPEITPAPAAAATPLPQTEVAMPGMGNQYIQLGAFLQQANADRLRMKAAKLGPVKTDTKLNDQGATLYIVRMGPYETVEESTKVLAQLNGLGINPKLVSK